MPAVLSLLALFVPGCDHPAEPGDPIAGVGLAVTTAAGLQFMTQEVDPPILMEALYQGRVASDAAGCIGLAGPDAATVVWPSGFRLRAGLNVVEVLRADGTVLGVLGQDFEFGGGFAPDLHDGLGFSSADRDRARARCPGPYWIVGEVAEAR